MPFLTLKYFDFVILTRLINIKNVMYNYLTKFGTASWFIIGEQIIMGTSLTTNTKTVDEKVQWNVSLTFHVEMSA